MGGALQNLIGGVESMHEGNMKGHKTLVENTCEGVHHLVKLAPIILQACKSTKNELLHTDFSIILGRF